MANITKPEVAMMDPITCLKIIDALTNNEAATARELSDQLNLPIKSVMAVLAHPEFTRRFRKLKREVAQSEFDAVGHDQMIQVLRTAEKDKDRVAAYKAMADVLGVSPKKAGPTVNVNLSFDAIIRDAQAKGTDEEIVYPGFED